MRSPNQDARACPVACIVLHYTGMTSLAAARDRLCDRAAKVSAHYLIAQDGQVEQLVDDADRAWHAGRSLWRGCRDLNSASIGIELCNPGHEHGYRPFPDAQMAALEALLGELVHRHSLDPRALLAHSDIAPDRKEDPGELFDWARLARAGFGVWPAGALDVQPDVQRAGEALGRIGYGWPLDEQGRRLVLVAFQRRFRQHRIDGDLDPETMGLIIEVARIWHG